MQYLKDWDGNDTVFPNLSSYEDTNFLQNRIWSDLKWFIGGLSLVNLEEVDWSMFWKWVQDARRAKTEEELEAELLDMEKDQGADEIYDRFDFVNLVDEEREGEDEQRK